MAEPCGTLLIICLPSFFFKGVWGFITGGLTWFAIPFSLATTMGLAYLGMSSAQGAPLLTDADISKGLAAPLVAQKLLGETGEYAMLFLILMAVMSTGSAEVIAVASIIIYDVYQVSDTIYLFINSINMPKVQKLVVTQTCPDGILRGVYVVVCPVSSTYAPYIKTKSTLVSEPILL